MYTYCLECGWQASTATFETDTAVSKSAIEHFVETGHTVESVRLPPPAVVLESSSNN
ncbi:hypothetical protein C495_15818 [Natronorubrum sulfidifaciens JCM 14089]|uniref:DUF1059 domain-containing protein n=1 Tax=Natronorubrum sulfidifaciens JCM 14089 TaxID=1230460 RepID=L9VYE3_9EURY|nr:hypothetical protein C495_15818 [Natronorubrum sulfidifaciens JCM 14089]